MTNSEKLYPTIWGDISFEEFHLRTKRIVAHSLQVNGLTNPEDIDDCLQDAYFKVWKKLQSNAHLFADKPLNYLVRSVYFCTKSQRFSHLRHSYKIAHHSQLEQKSRHSISYEQIETWIDLQNALVAVFNQLDDSEYALFAFYSLITEVKVSELIRHLGCKRSTMTRYRAKVRNLLQQEIQNSQVCIEEQPQDNFIPVSVALALLQLSST